jgi:biotin transport system substrate-specific component
MKNQKNTILLDSLLSFKSVAIRNMTLVFVFSIALWVSAKIQVPFYPVPITFQTLVIFLIGMVCGWRLGLATLGFYYLQALIGLPVLAGTPEKGIGLTYMLGPTGGYLVGFVFAILITGYFAGKNVYQSFFKTIPILVLANLAIYAAGASWLSSFIGWEKAVQFGIAPFLYGDLVKIALAILIVGFGFRFQKK